MRILMLSDVFFPRVNGVSTSIQTFGRSFLEFGHEVTLIAPLYPESYDTDFEVLRIPARRLPFDPEDRLMSLRAITGMLAQLRERNFDIVHIQTPFVAHYAGLRLARQLGLKTVSSYHTFFEAYLELYLPWIPDRWLRFLARHYSRKQCEQVDGVISPSQQMLTLLREYGVSKAAAVIPTGLPLEQFMPPAENHFRQLYGIPLDATVLLFVGRVAFEKNIEFLIAVFDLLRPRVSRLKLVIAGEGPALSTLKDRTMQSRYGNDIHFIGYLDRRTALIECYSACDLFVFASQTETQGLVLLEAMACGLPVIATASMGSIDVLRENEGCLISPLLVEPFAKRVELLLNDADRRREIAQRGRAYVQQWRTTAKAEEMLAFYHRTLGHRVADKTLGELHPK